VLGTLAGWCLAVAAVTYGLGLALTGDPVASLGNPYLILVVTVCYLLPLELVFSTPQVVARVRADREWAALLALDEGGARL
jgi:hypothetical protein